MTPFIFHTRSHTVVHLIAVGTCLFLLQCAFSNALEIGSRSESQDDNEDSKMDENLTKESSKNDETIPTEEMVSPPGTPASMELESSSTFRPSSSQPPSTTEPAPTTSATIYRLTGSSGGVCILLQVDAILSFEFVTTAGEEREGDIFIPEDASVSGECTTEDQATMLLQWKTYTLVWYFAKTPGGERWYVEKIDLSFNTNEKLFEHIVHPGQTIRMTTPKDRASLLFPTPVGKSYLCTHTETTVDLVPKEGYKSKDAPKATLLLRDLKLQPFIFKNDQFGPEYVCTPGGSGFRDETAPIAVGSTFAIIVLLTVAGYGIYRHFKVKKVQYDTME